VTVPANALTTMLRYSTYTAVGQRPTGRVLVFSPEIAAHCRSLGLRWIRLAEQAQETGAPSWTNDATLGQSTPRGFVTKARPSDVRLLAKLYTSLEADAVTLGRSSC
jgi:hypothetical protein